MAENAELAAEQGGSREAARKDAPANSTRLIARAAPIVGRLLFLVLVTTMSKKRGLLSSRTPRAPAHGELADAGVHIFVDDQNLFWGITNDKYGKGFRIDFGRLALEAAMGPTGHARPIRSAYIAGVIPDDDSFWKIAENAGFRVKRGYLGTKNRSKQDDAYLITEIVATLYEQPGPATIIVVAGDADYGPPLEKVTAKRWRSEIAFIDHSVSVALEPHVHQFREILPTSIQRYDNYPV